MICPVCSNQLRQIKTASAIVDHCPRCRGIWFDFGELSDFIKALSASDKIQPKKTTLFQHHAVKGVHTVKEKNRLCPKCKKSMRPFNYAGDSNVFLDKCPLCSGIWADGGEAKKLAEYIKEDPNITAVGQNLVEALKVPDESNDLNHNLGYFLFLPKVIVPLSSDVPPERFPVITISIIALTTLFYLVRLFFDPSGLVEIFDFLDDNIFKTDLISSMALGTGIVSLIWNMLFLWLFGDNVEDRFSRIGYLFFYFCCGIFAIVLYWAFNSNLPILAIGISGAVSGVMGAYFVFYPVSKIKLFVIYKVVEIPSVVCLAAWILFQVMSPFLYKTEIVINTTCIANVGGFILGAIVAGIKKEH